MLVICAVLLRMHRMRDCVHRWMLLRAVMRRAGKVVVVVMIKCGLLLYILHLVMVSATVGAMLLVLPTVNTVVSVRQLPSVQSLLLLQV
jgi:hypothetical protein